MHSFPCYANDRDIVSIQHDIVDLRNNIINISLINTKTDVLFYIQIMVPKLTLFLKNSILY